MDFPQMISKPGLLLRAFRAFHGLRHGLPLCGATLGVLLLGSPLWLWPTPLPAMDQGVTGRSGMAQAEVRFGKAVIQVDVADSPELQSRGLGGRRHLAPNAGMLFVYDQKGRYAFWMRGMFIPIDIIWLDNRQVVHIEHNVPPPSRGTPDARLATYRPDTPANLVLELAAGRAKALGLKVGSQVRYRFNAP